MRLLARGQGRRDRPGRRRPPSSTQAPGSRPGNTGEGDARGEVAARLRHSSADGPDSTEAGGACRPTATSTPAAPDSGFGTGADPALRTTSGASRRCDPLGAARVLGVNGPTPTS